MQDRTAEQNHIDHDYCLKAVLLRIPAQHPPHREFTKVLHLIGQQSPTAYWQSCLAYYTLSWYSSSSSTSCQGCLSSELSIITVVLWLSKSRCMYRHLISIMRRTQNDHTFFKKRRVIQPVTESLHTKYQMFRFRTAKDCIKFSTFWHTTPSPHSFGAVAYMSFHRSANFNAISLNAWALLSLSVGSLSTFLSFAGSAFVSPVRSFIVKT